MINLKIPNFAIGCLPGVHQFEKPRLTGYCELALGLHDSEVDVDLDVVSTAPASHVAHQVDSAGRFASLDFDGVDAEEAFEVAETKDVANVEVEDIAEQLHCEAGVGVGLSEVELSSEVEILAEVEMLLFAVERPRHL